MSKIAVLLLTLLMSINLQSSVEDEAKAYTQQLKNKEVEEEPM